MAAAVDPLFDVAGQVIVVTGASSGIGRHLATFLASRRATVVLTARRAQALQEAVAEIQGKGGAAVAVPMDVSSAESVSQAVDAILQKCGRIDCLINNAGTNVDGKLSHKHTEVEFDMVMNTNLKGVWLLCNAVATRSMMPRGGGTIVNIGSITAHRPVKGSVGYTAAKAGLVMLSKTLALEWASKSIRVNVVDPGFILTDINRHALGADGDAASENGKKIIANIPMRRFVTVQDLEGPILLLASRASSGMTGSVIAVDGGHLVSNL
eukprot:TRINITY_DN60969_c0_g1_i2.p1 TRINITY_DN60969_c0_g1~~TRINITY_DN60969_c0_g1_i2.p1  ORF type:complete len:267 (+),score=60.41 TRINITY_DN60969_c0_g1_i2:68-868(+)